MHFNTMPKNFANAKIITNTKNEASLNPNVSLNKYESPHHSSLHSTA